MYILILKNLLDGDLIFEDLNDWIKIKLSWMCWMNIKMLIYL